MKAASNVRNDVIVIDLYFTLVAALRDDASPRSEKRSGDTAWQRYWCDVRLG
jgi:hypothetical protein